MSNRSKTLEGLRKARARGRKPGRPLTVSDAAITATLHLGTLAGAKKVGLSKTQYIARRKRLETVDAE